MIANAAEAAYVAGLLAVIFVPYLCHLGLILVPEIWRKQLFASLLLFAHAVLVIVYMIFMDRVATIHRGDAGLGDACLLLGCVGLNLLASFIVSILASIKRKKVLGWLAVQSCATILAVIWILK